MAANLFSNVAGPQVERTVTRRGLLKGSLVGAAALATGSALTACDSPSAGTGTANSTASGASGGGGKATVRLWTWYNEQRDEWPKLVSEFQAKNPNIVVQNRVFGDPNAFLPALQSAVSAGDPPEIFAPHVLALSYGQAGVTADLRKELGADFLSDFFESANQEYTDNGKQYALGWMAQTFGIFYDPEAFKKAGIDGEPATWDEFLEVAQKLKSAGLLPCAMSNNPGTSGLDFVLPLVTQASDDPTLVLDLDQQRNGKRWDDPAVVAALQKTEQLVKGGAFVPNANGIADAQAQQLLYTGKAAMYFGGSWVPQGFVQNAPKSFVERYKIMQNPAWAPGKKHWTSNQAGAGLAVSNTSKNKDAALEFVKFMYDRARYTRTMNNSNSMPATKTSAADVSNPKLKLMTSWLLQGNGCPHILFGKGSSDSAANAVAGLIGGQAQAEATAKRIQSDVEQARNK